MARKAIVELIDDLDGSEAHESLTFALNGVEHEIDLSTANADKLRELFEEFAAAGRRVTPGKSKKVTAKAKAAATNKESRHAIREWARANGEKIGDRGRIPGELIARFQAAHEH